jgi:hypothetical protein
MRAIFAEAVDLDFLAKDPAPTVNQRWKAPIRVARSFVQSQRVVFLTVGREHSWVERLVRGGCEKVLPLAASYSVEQTETQVANFSTEASKVRSICALFIGLRLLCTVLGVIR